MKREHRISSSLESTRVGDARRELQGIFGVVESGAQLSESAQNTTGTAIVRAAEGEQTPLIEAQPTKESEPRTVLSTDGAESSNVIDIALHTRAPEVVADAKLIEAGFICGQSIMHKRRIADAA